MSARVLVLDDSLTVRMDLNDAFVAAGFDVTLCTTVNEARTAVAGAAFAVLILDVVLPDGDGVDLLAELRRAPATADIPIMLLSAEAEVADRVRGLKTGADEYVGKPYDSAYVVARAAELARRTVPGRPEATRNTVLVIDDSPTFREELRRALTGAGYTVMLAASGEEGLRAAAHSRPGAIVVDGVLPGIDGATVIRRVRLDGALRAVPCLLLTGSEGSGAELRALDAGADAFVRKEEDLDVILAKLSAVMRRANVSVPIDEPVSALGPKTILAVDDSPTFLNELAETLRGDGYDVVLARSGEEALELLGVQMVDCILLDLVMPGMSGEDTCRRIKSAPGVRDIPLIMLTAVEDRKAMIDGLRAGADDYISKTSELEVLRARVRAQIRRKQFEDENRRIRDELLRKELETIEARAAAQLAATRAELVDELERKNAELESFSYSVSHDLRAPLRSIDGFSAAVLEEYGAALDATAIGYLHRVRAATKRMGELIDDLLELSRVGRAPLKRGPVDLTALANAVVAELARRDPQRTVDVGIQSDVIADGDAGLLRIILDNLLGNAWKFTARADGARIELGCEPHDEGMVYFVRDNGAGFNASHAEKLFRPFQRLHAEVDFPGTGIGLATVHRIVDRHGGRVWAEGASGKGATFRFTLGRTGRRLSS